jgi:hypothetical protein
LPVDLKIKEKLMFLCICRILEKLMECTYLSIKAFPPIKAFHLSSLQNESDVRLSLSPFLSLPHFHSRPLSISLTSSSLSMSGQQQKRVGKEKATEQHSVTSDNFWHDGRKRLSTTKLCLLIGVLKIGEREERERGFSQRSCLAIRNS